MELGSTLLVVERRRGELSDLMSQSTRGGEQVVCLLRDGVKKKKKNNRGH